MALCGASDANEALKRRLDKRVLQELVANTDLNEAEVKSLYARFRRVVYPETTMTLEKFRNTMGIIGMSADQWLPEAMYRVFCEGAKTLSYRQYIKYLAIMLRGTEDQKLEMSFRMAVNGSQLEKQKRGGQATGNELVMGLHEFENLVKCTDCLLRSLVSHPGAEVGKDRIAEVFQQLSSVDPAGGTGSEESCQSVITLDDYKNAARCNPDFLEMLGFGRAKLPRISARHSMESGNSGHTSPPEAKKHEKSERWARQKLEDVRLQLHQLQQDFRAVANGAEVTPHNHSRPSASKYAAKHRQKAGDVGSSEDSCSSSSSSDDEFWWSPTLKANARSTSRDSVPHREGVSVKTNLSDVLATKIDQILLQLEEDRGTYSEPDSDIQQDTLRKRPGRFGTAPATYLSDTQLTMASSRTLPHSVGRVTAASPPLETMQPFFQHFRKAQTTNFRDNLRSTAQKHKKQPKIHRLLGPKKGLAVHFGHENWNMVINMMVGIRLAVGRASSEPRRKLQDFDFNNKEKFSILPRLGNIFDSVAGSKIQCTRFIDYAAFAFRKVRELNGINSEDYLRSVGPEQLLGNMILGNLSSLSELSSEGKSGAFFYYTADGQYMMKTVTKEEKDLLRKMLADYWAHMCDNPNSLLIHFYGLHSLRVKKQNQRLSSQTTYQKLYFVVMGNIFKTPLEIHMRYDLKGSALGRTTYEDHDTSVARKDNDFLDDVAKSIIKRLRIGADKRAALIDQIRRDAEFLERRNIIDYSVLLGIHNFQAGERKEFGLDDDLTANEDDMGSEHESLRSPNGQVRWQRRRANMRGFLSERDDDSEGCVYFLGIIDILTYYGGKKKLEHNFKRLRYPGKTNQISCCPPEMYAQRFINFMEKEVIVG